MSGNCEKNFDKVLGLLHSIVIYSNILYLMAGIYALVIFPGLFKLFGVYILLITLVSFIHHTNLNIGALSASVFGVLDIVLANLGLLVAIILSIVFYKRFNFNMATLILVAIMGALSIVTFVLSEIEAKRAKRGDPIKSLPKGVLADTKVNYTQKSQQVLYLVWHTIWHLVSGFAAILWIVSINIKK